MKIAELYLFYLYNFTTFVVQRAAVPLMPMFFNS